MSTFKLSTWRFPAFVYETKPAEEYRLLMAINHYTKKKKILPRRYTCTLSFSTNDWNRWFLIISLIFCGETKGIKLCIQWKLIRDRKSRKQPDGLLFHNWLIQRIPLPFSEIVFRPITQTCKFSFHSKEM